MIVIKPGSSLLPGLSTLILHIKFEKCLHSDGGADSDDAVMTVLRTITWYAYHFIGLKQLISKHCALL